MSGWEVGSLLVTVALGAWLRWPGGWLAWIALVVALASGAFAFRARRAGTVIAALLGLGAAATALVTTRRVDRIARHWPDVREELIQQASRRLTATLSDAVLISRTLARGALIVSAGSQELAFERLNAVQPEGAERGVVVLDSLGHPWAWAGRQRLPPSISPRELQARITPFYVVLEAHRQANGRTAIGHVVLSADSAVVDAEETVAARFARANSVHLSFLAPRSAPEDNDVFDYCTPECGVPGADTLFSVRTVAPQQQDAAAGTLAQGGGIAGWLLLGLVVAVAICGGGLARLATVPLLTALGVLTPLGDRLGLHALFSGDTYLRPELGPAGSSLGALSLVALLLILVVSALAQPQNKRSPAWPLGALLVLAAPPLLYWLADGIRMPPNGAGSLLWLSWAIGLALAGAAILLIASRLLSSDGGRELSWVVPVLAALAAGLGLAFWAPRGGLPAWDLALWIPAFFSATLGSRWRHRVAAVALVAGAVAATLTWDITARQRVRLAERDAARLGPGGGDPVVGSLLDRFGAELSQGPMPRSESALYARWARSPLAADHYPAVLVAWSPNGQMTGRLDLSELDLPPPLLRALAENARVSGTALVEPLTRVPGLHYVLAVPFPDGEVVTVGVGPRSRVIRPARTAELLPAASVPAAPYEMSLSVPQSPAIGAQLQWQRDGWTVRGEERLDFPDGSRHLHVQVALGAPGSVAVRGALIVLVDVGLVTVMWLFGGVWVGRRPWLHWAPSRLVRPSYRARLTWVLALFFVVPTVGFALWTGARARAEARAARDLSIRQTLHDAERSARDLLSGPPDRADRGLDELANHFGADLQLYQGGLLAQTSADAVAQLGLMDYLLPPEAYRAMALDDRLEFSSDAALAGRTVRVGYETLAEYADGPAVLAVARPLADPATAAARLDLAYGLLLATLAALSAAWGFAAVAARVLAKPVQVLREAAVRVGHGESMVPAATELPAEFGPVAEAVGQMAQAVRVLAWGELARQIAHEIKNPLTPIRLGIQHLLRAHKDGRGDFDAQLDKTSKQILGEIERLDTIARAFARFGAPQAEAGPLEAVDAATVARDTAQLYALGSSVAVSVRGTGGTVRARKDELREVLINLIENARDADANTVTIELVPGAIVVADDGKGIPPEHVSRIFEPQFSTTTSGTGLGLAICKRLVEGWGGSIGVETEVGKGTTVRLNFGDGRVQ